MKEFKLNQIVRGKNAGIFVIIGRTQVINGEQYYKLKECSPDLKSTARGELSLPESAIVEYYK